MKQYTDKELADHLLEMRRCDGRASLRSYFKRNGWRLFLFFGFVIVLLGLGLFAQSWGFCGFIFGLVFGILSRDRAHAQQLQKIWPFYGRVIDWLKVEKIAGGEPSAQHEARPPQN
jgi:hypothetical protein